PPPPQPTVGCCLPNGACVNLTVADCTAQSGTSRGDASTCEGPPCPQPAPPFSNSKVTGQYVSVEPTVVTDSANEQFHVGCGFCIPTTHTEGLTPRHAKALDVLESVGQGTNPACLPCH